MVELIANHRSPLQELSRQSVLRPTFAAVRNSARRRVVKTPADRTSSSSRAAQLEVLRAIRGHGTADGPRILRIGGAVHAAEFLEVNKPRPVVVYEIVKAGSPLTGVGSRDRSDA
jgi:hypothetical protein